MFKYGAHAPLKYSGGEFGLNFLGKEIDPATIEKIQQFMNTKEGNILKQQISKMSPQELKALMESAKSTNLDENKLKAILGKSSQEILGHIDLSKLEGKS